MLSDWKEQFSLPFRAEQSGEEYYAGSRFELSVFGTVITERAVPASEEILLILSPILDHTSARSCQCVDLALAQRRGRDDLQVLHLIRDSGPCFRRYENIWFNSVVLPRRLGAQIRTH